MYQIVQGGRTDAVQNPFIVRLKTDNVTYDPFDLTSVLDIGTCFVNADTTELIASLVGGQISIVGNPLLGKVLIALTAVQTALLKQVNLATLELKLTFATGNPIKVQIEEAYSVAESEC